MSDKPATPQTLAVFLLDDHDAARDFLKIVQAIDKADDKVTIVDAAIADRSKRRGSVKVHQTEDTGGLKGGLRGGAIGVVVGTILLGPAGPLVGGAVGGVLAGLHNRFRDIGIDDKFMKQVAGEVEKGRSALFVLYQGDWSGSIGAISDAVKSHHALLIQSTLPAEAAAQLKALVEPAADELGGEEVVADFEVETEPEEAPAADAVAEAVEEPAPLPGPPSRRWSPMTSPSCRASGPRPPRSWWPRASGAMPVSLTPASRSCARSSRRRMSRRRTPSAPGPCRRPSRSTAIGPDRRRS